MSVGHILVVIVFILLIGVVGYSIMLASKISCPTCYHDGERNPMLPIGGPLYWWCPECDSYLNYRDAMRTLQYDREAAAAEKSSRGLMLTERAESVDRYTGQPQEEEEEFEFDLLPSAPDDDDDQPTSDDPWN